MASRSRIPSQRQQSDRRRTWQSYQRWLASQTQEQLADHLTGINAALQAQSTTLLTSQLLSDYHRTIDQPVLSSMPMELPSSLTERARELSPASQRPDALALLSQSQRLGPRLAARLVLASARAQARKAEG